MTTPSSEFGTSADVDRGLALMGLSLPLTPEDLKRRYRELAKQWHPDLNPSDPQAGEKMKALTVAAEVLTGVDASALPRYTGATFAREMERTEFEAGGLRFTMSIGTQVGEIHASDWIYAAAFAAHSDAVYLAGYSGRVALVDEKGTGTRVYDIGSVPRRIVDTGDYLYLLTDTRLYVLHEDALHALVDTFNGGDLVVAQTAFGLIEKKRVKLKKRLGDEENGARPPKTDLSAKTRPDRNSNTAITTIRLPDRFCGRGRAKNRRISNVSGTVGSMVPTVHRRSRVFGAKPARRLRQADVGSS